MIKELMQYLGIAFPEGVYLGDAPENTPPPYLTVDENSVDHDDAITADAARSRVGSYSIAVYATDYASLDALLTRLRQRVDRVGDVFDLGGVAVGLMKIESEEDTFSYYLDDGETLVFERTINAITHYERI